MPLGRREAGKWRWERGPRGRRPSRDGAGEPQYPPPRDSWLCWQTKIGGILKRSFVSCLLTLTAILGNPLQKDILDRFGSGIMVSHFDPCCRLSSPESLGDCGRHIFR